MCCIGIHARILVNYNGQTCEVYPFYDSYKPITNVKMVNAAFAYNPLDGPTFVLHVNKMLDFTASMEHLLFSTTQVRMNGLIVDDCPCELDPRGYSTTLVYFQKKTYRLSNLCQNPQKRTLSIF